MSITVCLSIIAITKEYKINFRWFILYLDVITNMSILFLMINILDTWNTVELLWFYKSWDEFLQPW